MDHLLVITTCPAGDTAERLARHLVEFHLAACVNILPGIRSIYSWKDQVAADEEQLLLIKTRTETYDLLEQAIRQQHPYELPEVIAIPMARGSADYLSWIDAIVGKQL